MPRLLAIIIVLLVTTVIITGCYFSTCEKKELNSRITNKLEAAMEAIPVDDLNIKIIYDNNPYSSELETAWGFSCYIEGTERNILFDVGGNGEVLIGNMEKLNVDSNEISIVILSHIHEDHVGGIGSFLKQNSNVLVYIPDSFPENFEQYVENYGARVVRVKEPMKICKGVYSTGELGVWIKEQSLIVSTEKGLIVITGCAHPGIVKIVQTAKELVDNEVLLVIGGFHLGGYSSGEIDKIISNFEHLGVKYVGPCHCSGDTARKLFKEEFGKDYIDVGVGKKVDIKSLDC